MEMSTFYIGTPSIDKYCAMPICTSTMVHHGRPNEFTKTTSTLGERNDAFNDARILRSPIRRIRRYQPIVLSRLPSGKLT